MRLRRRGELLFQYMLLLRGATSRAVTVSSSCLFQYMLLLRGATYKNGKHVSKVIRFQYMLLLRGATRITSEMWAPMRLFQYMLLLRGATYEILYIQHQYHCFNTCSSCEEQLSRFTWTCRWRCFNTCSSCEEQLVSHVPSITAPKRFQYMLLLRGATRDRRRPRRSWPVSIHAPLARSNRRPHPNGLHRPRFQYMLLLRGAT